MSNLVKITDFSLVTYAGLLQSISHVHVHLHPQVHISKSTEQLTNQAKSSSYSFFDNLLHSDLLHFCFILTLKNVLKKHISAIRFKGTKNVTHAISQKYWSLIIAFCQDWNRLEFKLNLIYNLKFL